MTINAPRLLAGFGTLALLAAVGLFASHPAHSVGGPVPVTVANSPLATADLDNPDQQPFQITLSPYSNVSRSATDTYIVPAGKRMVIDYYSASLAQFPLGGYADLSLTTTVHGISSFYQPIPPASSTAPFNQMTRIYADPGTAVQAEVTSSSGAHCGGNIILSGHIVNVR